MRPAKTSLHQPYSITSNTPTQVEESNIEIPINSVDSNERLPGMESLSGDQLFFLNFAQVPDYPLFYYLNKYILINS